LRLLQQSYFSTLLALCNLWYVTLLCNAAKYSLIFILLKEEDVFVCDTCDLKDAPCNKESLRHDRENHPLVRYQHGVAEEAKTIESKLLALETNFGKLEKRFIDHQEAMASRFAALEDLLRTIAPRQ
jgi:hypothetical protein